MPPSTRLWRVAALGMTLESLILEEPEFFNPPQAG